MSLNLYRLTRSKMIYLLNEVAKLMYEEEDSIELVCIGGAALILFDDRFSNGTSSDIDVFLIDISPFPERFKDYVYEVTERENDNGNFFPHLEYDWINDDLVSQDILLDFNIDEYLQYLQEDNAMEFYNEYNEPVIKLIPARADIIIVSKILANRYKDMPIIDRYTTLLQLDTLDAFHEYCCNCLSDFSTDDRYIKVLAHISKNIYEYESIDELYGFFDGQGIHYNPEEVLEYYEDELWGFSS